ESADRRFERLYLVENLAVLLFVFQDVGPLQAVALHGAVMGRAVDLVGLSRVASGSQEKRRRVFRNSQRGSGGLPFWGGFLRRRPFGGLGASSRGDAGFFRLLRFFGRPFARCRFASRFCRLFRRFLLLGHVAPLLVANVPSRLGDFHFEGFASMAKEQSTG